jgi:hypothetical protein
MPEPTIEAFRKLLSRENGWVESRLATGEALFSHRPKSNPCLLIKVHSAVLFDPPAVVIGMPFIPWTVIRLSACLTRSPETISPLRSIAHHEIAKKDGWDDRIRDMVVGIIKSNRSQDYVPKPKDSGNKGASK